MASVATPGGIWVKHVEHPLKALHRRPRPLLLSTLMSILRRSPSLESVSSVRSLESMQSLDSAKSFSSAHSPGGESAKLSDYGDLNNIDMGRTITKAPVVPAVVDGDVEKPSPTDDGPPSTCDDERESTPTSILEPAPSDHRKHDRFYMDPRTIKLVVRPSMRACRWTG